MRWNLFSLLLLVPLLVGCVSTKTVRLAPDTIVDMNGKTMALSTSDKPDFTAMTAGKAMFGAFGAMAMISAGNEIVSANNVEDPALYIGNALSKTISEAHSLHPVLPVVSDNEDELSKLIAEHQQSDYILDVRTVNWSFTYFPSDWDNYRVVYSVKTRLIDTKSRDVVAEAFCHRAPDQTPESPSYEQLMENNATRLKEELHIAADHCLQELQEKLL